jgi:hypothetical protein
MDKDDPASKSWRKFDIRTTDSNRGAGSAGILAPLCTNMFLRG